MPSFSCGRYGQPSGRQLTNVCCVTITEIINVRLCWYYLRDRILTFKDGSLDKSRTLVLTEFYFSTFEKMFNLEFDEMKYRNMTSIF